MHLYHLCTGICLCLYFCWLYLFVPFVYLYLCLPPIQLGHSCDVAFQELLQFLLQVEAAVKSVVRMLVL